MKIFFILFMIVSCFYIGTIGLIIAINNLPKFDGQFILSFIMYSIGSTWIADLIGFITKEKEK